MVDFFCVSINCKYMELEKIYFQLQIHYTLIDSNCPRTSTSHWIYLYKCKKCILFPKFYQDKIAIKFVALSARGLFFFTMVTC